MMQRYALGAPIALSFSIQLCFRIGIKNRHKYSLRQLCRFPAHTCVIICRVLLLGVSVIACGPYIPSLQWIVHELRPVDQVLIQAGFCVLQLILQHAQTVVFPISTAHKTPDALLAEAFDATRLKAMRYRNRRSLACIEPGSWAAASFSQEAKGSVPPLSPRSPRMASRVMRRSPTILRLSGERLEQADDESANRGPRARWMRNSKEPEPTPDTPDTPDVNPAQQSGLGRWMRSPRNSKETAAAEEGSSGKGTFSEGLPPASRSAHGRWKRNSGEALPGEATPPPQPTPRQASPAAAAWPTELGPRAASPFQASSQGLSPRGAQGTSSQVEPVEPDQVQAAPFQASPFHASAFQRAAPPSKLRCGPSEPSIDETLAVESLVEDGATDEYGPTDDTRQVPYRTGTTIT